MALKCGIIGVANVGKSTLFNCMSNTKVETSSFAFTSSKSNIGVVNVPDPRLYHLEKFQPTEKIIPASVEIVDIPGLARGANQGEGVGNKFLSDIRNTDALIQVLRCFDDEQLPHIDGSVDPVRDIETLNLELQVKDLEATLRNAADAGVEAVAVGTPIDLARLVDIPLPWTRCRYELDVQGSPTLADALAPILEMAREGNR